MERLLEVCRAAYPDFHIEIYEEPWSQGDEFLNFYREFAGNKKYLGRIHRYQLADIIREDLINDYTKALHKALGIY